MNRPDPVRVVVAARDEKFWQNLCDAIGRPDLKDDPRSADNSARVDNRDYVVGVLSDVFLAQLVRPRHSLGNI